MSQLELYKDVILTVDLPVDFMVRTEARYSTIWATY